MQIGFPTMLSDESLLNSIAIGNREAFRELYQRHAAGLYGLCISILRDRTLAADALQEVSLAIWKGAGTFRNKRGSAVIWMNSLCRNRCIDLLRSRRYRPLDLDQYLEEVIPDSGPQPDDQAQAQQVRGRVNAALDHLPSEQKQLIRMAYQSGLTQSEIAVTLKLPLGTVKSRMRLGMSKLRLLLGDKPEDDE